MPCGGFRARFLTSLYSTWPSTTETTRMARVGATFRTIKPNVPAFHVWRVESSELVEVPRQNLGQFYDGESYVVYAAFEQGQSVSLTSKKSVRMSGVEHHIHFWLGLQCTQDEATVAAFKTVELDELIKGVGVQHREVQGHESPRFKAYFAHHRGMRIVRGVAGWSDAQAEDAKLYVVKGKRFPRATQLESVDWSHMNENNVFILHVSNIIFVWNGLNSNRVERLQAEKVANILKEGLEDTYTEVLVVDQDAEDRMPDEELEIFNQFLPLDRKSDMQTSVSDDGSEAASDLSLGNSLKLFCCSDESDGSLRVYETKSGPLFRSDLTSGHSFIVDNATSGVWVWVGRKASDKERSEALRNAQGFIKKKGYGAFTHVARVTENNEPEEFKVLFKTWKDKHDTTPPKTPVRRGLAPVVQSRFDAETLHTQPSLAASSLMVDDGSGALEVFRLKNKELIHVEERRENILCTSECYVILYAYNVRKNDHYMIYVWQGSDSTQEVRQWANLKARELDERLGGGAVRGLVSQGWETPHFLAIFKGQLRILQGSHKEAVEDRLDEDAGCLLQIHGRSELTTKSTQVPLTTSSLNTNDCFVLIKPREAWVWMGKGSTGDEREMAKRVALSQLSEMEVVFEEHEGDNFWNNLDGNKEEYVNKLVVREDNHSITPRLFHLYCTQSGFKKEEVLDFKQSDLVIEDLMILDVYDTVFIWVGKYSKEDINDCFDLAKFYLESDPTDRNVNTPLIAVKQGHEPTHFKGFFSSWNDQLLNIELPEQTRDDGHDDVVDHHVNGIEVNGIEQFYSFYELTNGHGLGNEVDPRRKEMYLTDSEFESVFNMDKETFVELPKWRQEGLKRSVGLF